MVVESGVPDLALGEVKASATEAGGTAARESIAGPADENSVAMAVEVTTDGTRFDVGRETSAAAAVERREVGSLQYGRVLKVQGKTAEEVAGMDTAGWLEDTGHHEQQGADIAETLHQCC